MSVLRVAVLRPALAAMILLAAQSALAVDYYADPVGGLWTANTTWHVGSPGGVLPTPGSYPGVGVGDRAFLMVPPAAVSVTTVIPNGVELSISCASCFVSINSGGTLNLIGASSISAGGGMALNAGGTLTGSGTTTFDSGTQFGVSGGTLDGHTLNLNGNLTQTGAWSIDNGGQIVIGATGLYDIQTTGAVTTNNAATSKITNNGTFRKSSGAGGTNVVVPVYNNNLVQAQVNTLVLGAAPVHTSSTFDISSGASIEFHGTFTGTCTIQGAGTAKIVGTPALDSGAILNVSAAILMSGGWIQGPAAGSATMNVSGPVTFDGGKWVQNLNVNMLSGSTLDFTGAAAASISNAHVDNNAGALIKLTPGGGLSLDNTGWISNNGTFRLLGDAIISTNGVGSSRMDNNNLFEKTAGAGIAGINVTLNNTAPGSVSSTSGNITFTKSGSHTGTFNVCGGCFFDFSNGTHTFDGSSFNGSTGFTKVSNIGTFFTGSGGAVVNTQLVQTGGTISGTGILGVNNIFTWMGGTQDGSGETSLGAFSHAFNGSTGAMTLARKLTNNGTITYNGATNVLSINTGGWLLNNSTFNIIGDYNILGSGTGLFGNASAAAFLNKTAGTGFARLSCEVDNAGTINVTNGQMALNGGGTNTNVISIPAVANVLAIEAGSYDFAGGTFINPGDLGLVRVSGGTLFVTTSITVPALEVNSGIVDVSSPNTFQIMTLKWNGGTMQGAGTKRVFGGLIGNAAATTLDGTGTMTLAGASFSYDADNTNFLLLNGSSKLNIESGCVMTMTGNGWLAGSLFSRLTSTGGTLAKTGGSTARIDAMIDFTSGSGGTIHVVAGFLELSNGGTFGGSAGTLQIDAGAYLKLTSGTFDLNASATITGTGTFWMVQGAVTVNANTPITIPNLLFGAGVLTGPANITIGGGSWNGGNLTGTGSTIVPNGASFAIDGLGTVIFSRPFVNNGTVDFTAGAFLLSATAPFDNNGTLTVSSTRLSLDGGGTHTGDFVVNALGILRFGAPSHTFAATSDISGTGTIEFNAPTSTLSGTYALTGSGLTKFMPGSTTLFNTTAPASSPKVDITANVGGTAAFNVTAAAVSTWNGGALTGTAPFTIAAAVAFNCGGTQGPMDLQRPLINDGSMAFHSLTNVLALDNGSIDNNGMFIDGGTANVVIGPGGGTFNNDGTFQRYPSASSVTFDPAFTNNNLARFFSGPVAFNGGYTQTAGATELNGGHIFSPLSIDINGGSVIGSGTINGNVTSDGVVAPGLSPGAINITGDYTQSAAGTLNIEIGGTVPGTGYDQLNVGGTANLDGTVNVTVINAFVPTDGDIFDVLTFATRNGDFATKSIPAFPGGTFSNLYTATAFRLVANIANDLSIVKTGPIGAQPGDVVSYTITVSNSGPGSADNVVVSDPGHPALSFVGNSGDCATPFPCSLGTISGGASKTITATYTVDFGSAGSTVVNTATASSTPPDASSGNNSASANVVIGCVNGAPSSLAPSGPGVPTSGTLSWSPTGGETYIVYLGPAGSGCTTLLGTTSGTSMAYAGLAADTTYEWRVESSVAGCPILSSGCVSFTTAKTTDCTPPPAPLASVVGQATSSKTYAVQWDAVPNAVRYEVDEATSADFANATTTSTTGLAVRYKHDTGTPVAWYYRVRAFVACTALPGPNAPTIRIIIVPLPPADRPNPSATVPVGTEELVVQQIFIPGEPGQTLFFSAFTDRPWLAVRPSSGVLPPEGVTLEVIGNVKDLPNGTFTASIIVTINASSANGSTTHITPSTSTTPFSVNIVTPVTPVTAKPATSQYALIIPSVGHLDGINSHWQSDVRVTNAGFRSTRYRLTFTPSAGTATGVKQTTITVDAGATTALDDVIKNWFGAGSLGDGTNGMLEILPLDDPANASLATVASSRTYNVTGTSGTLGQFIPAVPFPSFIGRAASGAFPPTLSLQQIAQSGVFRTNVGLAEAGGKPANATISIFNGAGLRLLDIPQALAAGQQIQLNALLAQHGIELTDGRIEVNVGSGDGKITAYASVIDGSTGDPLLVSGALLGSNASTKYVLPGVANLNNPIAHWRTDVRVFNYGTIDQPATLTFYPFASAPSTTVEVLLAAGKVVALDNILASRFGLENTGGVVHLATAQPATLVVTARTFNQTDNGTFGQFIPAVTPNDATGIGGRTLNILQVEDSTRYRTNIGLAEVTGKPATVELQVYLPDAKITPTVQVSLAANEFRQFALIRELGIGNVYNARVTVRVIGGEGKVTAYGSVIDEITQDPTYVPAQ